MTIDDRLLSPERVARELDLSVSAVIRRIRTGAITGVKLHSRPDCDDSCHCPWRVRASAVNVYVNKLVEC